MAATNAPSLDCTTLPSVPRDGIAAWAAARGSEAGDGADESASGDGPAERSGRPARPPLELCRSPSLTSIGDRLPITSPYRGPATPHGRLLRCCTGPGRSGASPEELDIIDQGIAAGQTIAEIVARIGSLTD